jgi:ferredoxin
MTESIQFHTDLYRRDALERAAEKYQGRASIELAESGSYVVARLQLLAPDAAGDVQLLRDEFCAEALSLTVQSLRDLAAGAPRDPARPDPAEREPPWALLAPFTEGVGLGGGWILESLSPIRGGASTMVLRHERDGVARVSIRRNGGLPVGVAHTDHLDFLLMNGGGGTAETDDAIRRVLIDLVRTVRPQVNGGADTAALAALLPHSERPASPDRAAGNGAAPAAPRAGRVAPHVDPNEHTISFELDEAGLNRLALYDAVLALADRCYIFVARRNGTRIGIDLKPRGQLPIAAFKVLVRDATTALNHVVRSVEAAAPASDRHGGLPALGRRRVDMNGLLAELEAADPATLGLGVQSERGPSHENLRVLNIRGTGACNSECVFCIEKFNPTHRPMLNADGTRELILNSAGNFDMLFFAAGEPTIHPNLFEYVALAKRVGFTCFGMSSHFRTFSDPRFALQTLQAGFEYFDIALHAPDPASQLEVNPIGDDGRSLAEALKGLAIVIRLADVLGIRVSITHKIVISRLNVTQLEPIFRSTYDRGVRHFILQPVRAMGIGPEAQAKLAISEEEITPHLNALLRRTAGLGAVLKPYGFSRQDLFSGGHVESEQNRVKNIYGKARHRRTPVSLPTTEAGRPQDGRHWIAVTGESGGPFRFASDGRAPILDDSLREGVRLPFGCRMGSCGMCCARLLEGRVDQSSQIFLSEDQMQAGFVLLCQARPLSDVVVRLCTDDEIDHL